MHNTLPASDTPEYHPASKWRSVLPWLAWAVVLITADQWLKHLILTHYAYGDSTAVTGFFNIVRAHNTGAAFSFLASHGGWQRWLFTGIAVAASLVMLWLMVRHPRQKLFCFALACIMGGAIGNVTDRVRHGYVVDFLDFHWPWLEPVFHMGHFPAFNLADAAITAGAALLILDELLRMRRARA